MELKTILAIMPCLVIVGGAAFLHIRLRNKKQMAKVWRGGVMPPLCTYYICYIMAHYILHMKYATVYEKEVARHDRYFEGAIQWRSIPGRADRN